MGLNCFVSLFASKSELATDPFWVVDLEDFQDGGGLRTGTLPTAVQTPATFWRCAEVNGECRKSRMSKHIACVSAGVDDKVWESEDGLTEGLDIFNLGTGKRCPWGHLVYPVHTSMFSTTKSHTNFLIRQLLGQTTLCQCDLSQIVLSAKNCLPPPP